MDRIVSREGDCESNHGGGDGNLFTNLIRRPWFERIQIITYMTLGYTWPHKHDRNTPFEELFEPINPRQLLPKCSHEGCPNPVKSLGWCGVHLRSYTKSRQ